MTQYMNPPPTVSGWTPLPSDPVAGPSSAVTPPVSSAGTSPSAATNNIPHRQRRRPQAAYDILSAFYHNVTDRPTAQQRRDLAEQVRRIPGCEDYTPINVSGYFSRKRQAEAARLPLGRAHHQVSPAAPLASMTSAKILFPSLTRDRKSIERLEVLLGDDPDPSIEIAGIWAERIGHNAKANDILTYARLRRAQKGYSPQLPPSDVPTMPPLPRLQPFSAPRTQASQLPTPSTSPEPGSLPTSPVVDSHRISGRIMVPVTVKEEEDELESDEEMELESDTDSEVEVSLSATVAHTSIAIPSGVQHDLVTSLHKVFSQPRTAPGNDAAVPRSFSQLSQWMGGGQEQTVTTLLDEISKGTYAHLGLKPSISTGPSSRT